MRFGANNKTPMNAVPLPPPTLIQPSTSNLRLPGTPIRLL